MKRFLKEEYGNAVLWSLFIILILCALSAVIYSAVMVYANYQTAETDLQEAACISTDLSMENANVRDMQLDIPVSAETALEENMTEAGWVKGNDGWAKYEGDKMLYRLEDMRIDVTNMTIQIGTTFSMPLPWAIGNVMSVQIPMQIRSSILYVN